MSRPCASWTRSAGTGDGSPSRASPVASPVSSATPAGRTSSARNGVRLVTPRGFSTVPTVGMPAPRRTGPKVPHGRGVTWARSRGPSAPGAASDPPGRSGAGPRPSLARAHGSAYRRADRLAVRPQRLVLRVVLQVEGELVDPERGELAQALDVPLGRADDAEPVDDLVGDERGVRVPRAPVLVVVVAVAAGDEVGERVRDGHARALLGAAGTVARDDLRDVVADHPAEPAAL